jgi:hypothetical protein
MMQRPRLPPGKEKSQRLPPAAAQLSGASGNRFTVCAPACRRQQEKRTR